MNKAQLMKKYGIKSIGGGEWGKGFLDCLKSFDEKNIQIFKFDFMIKRVEFAQKNDLPYTWLLNQLKHDWKKGTGLIPISHSKGKKEE